MTDVNASVTRAAGGRVRRWEWAVAAVTIVAVAGLAVWRHLARPVDRQLSAIVGVLAADPSALPPADDRHRVPLTGRFAGATPHDEMFLTRRDDGSFLALFPTYYGSGPSIACLLYTSRPLRPGDTYLRQPTLGQSDRVIDAPPYRHMTFDGRVDDHWYRVSYGMR